MQAVHPAGPEPITTSLSIEPSWVPFDVVMRSPKSVCNAHAALLNLRPPPSVRRTSAREMQHSLRLFAHQRANGRPEHEVTKVSALRMSRRVVRDVVIIHGVQQTARRFHALSRRLDASRA